MTKEAIEKIELLIENEFTDKVKPSKETSDGMKALGLASLSGLIGAGIDTYLSGTTDIKDFVKPMAAWGAGGSLAHILTSKKNKKGNNEF